MSQLTSHVLDTSKGRPAAGIRVLLYKLDTEEKIAQGITNADGRVTDLLSPGLVLEPSAYKIIFKTGDYFRKENLDTFYPFVEISFFIKDQSHYHIPLLLSQYGFTTYRGS